MRASSVISLTWWREDLNPGAPALTQIKMKKRGNLFQNLDGIDEDGEAMVAMTAVECTKTRLAGAKEDFPVLSARMKNLDVEGVKEDVNFLVNSMNSFKLDFALTLNSKDFRHQVEENDGDDLCEDLENEEEQGNEEDVRLKDHGEDDVFQGEERKDEEAEGDLNEDDESEGTWKTVTRRSKRSRRVDQARRRQSGRFRTSLEMSSRSLGLFRRHRHKSHQER